MDNAFFIIAALTAGAGMVAFCLRNLVHSVLALVITFAGLAALYLLLGAQFVGFAEIMVYIGAVGILILFAVLLTRGGESEQDQVASPRWLVGLIVAIVGFSALVWAILHSSALPVGSTETPEATVRMIGEALLTRYILPLEVLGVLLTAALIGAVLIAMRDEGGSR